MIQKPPCGGTAAISSTTSTITVVVGTLFSVGSGVGAIVAKVGAVGTGAAAAAAAAAFVVAAAALAALVTLAAISVFYYEHCLMEPSGIDACTAGVIEEIVPAYSSTVEQIFPFIGMHDRVDVVIKSAYWFLVLRSTSVKCVGPDDSPVLSGFYRNDQVCNAGLGSIIGGAIGGVAGVLIAAALVAAIGCATWFLCILALIVAVVIAIVAVVIGAMAGSAVGKAVTRPSVPTSSGGGLIPAMPLAVGDYVTTRGNLAPLNDFGGIIVYWFVRNTSLHGRSTGSPPFSFTDPDKNLPIDACGPTSPPIQ